MVLAYILSFIMGVTCLYFITQYIIYMDDTNYILYSWFSDRTYWCLDTNKKGRTRMC